ncbi:MAG TPA: hypothetical protein V6D22_09080 [Candidatus Obscuribacterales bacterium]
MSIGEAMLVKELIAELQKYPPDTLVTTACYEFGFQALTKVQPVTLCRLPVPAAVSATHVFANWSDHGSEPISAVCLGELEPGIAEGCEPQQLESSV